MRMTVGFVEREVSLREIGDAQKAHLVDDEDNEQVALVDAILSAFIHEHFIERKDVV